MEGVFSYDMGWDWMVHGLALGCVSSVLHIPTVSFDGLGGMRKRHFFRVWVGS